MPFFDGATGRVYYRHWSTDDPDAAVVFLHGFGEHTGVYHRLAAALNAAGIDLWALDEIGHGLSDGARGDVTTMDNLVANGQQLTDLAAASGVPLVIAGHSLGAVAATLTALRHGDRYRGAVLSGALLREPEWFSAVEPGDDLALDLDGLSADPFYRDALENDPLAFTEADVVGVLKSALPPAWDEFDRDLAALTIPVLAINGSDDEIAPAADVAAVAGPIDRIETVVHKGRAHDILNEVNHREVAADVVDFVHRVTSN